MPTRPCPPAPSGRSGGAAPGPPSSSTSRVSASASCRSRTVVATVPACRSTFDSASCATRYADTSRLRGSAPGSPLTSSATGSPAARTPSSRSPRFARDGCGAGGPAADSSRRMPTSARSSSTDWRPSFSTPASTPASTGRSSSRVRTTPTWSTMTLTACATASWISREMRTRSSITAACARASRSASSVAARVASCSARSRSRRTRRPTQSAAQYRVVKNSASHSDGPPISAAAAASVCPAIGASHHQWSGARR